MSDEQNPEDDGRFQTTHWSAVSDVHQSDSVQAHVALTKLCQIYWHPLFTFIRHQGYPSADAKDLVQGFFEQVLEKEQFKTADPAKGTFRTFLLTTLKRFLSQQQLRAKRLKRGGGQEIISIEDVPEENQGELEDTGHLTPDELYDRNWAEAVLRQALDRVRQEYASRNDLALFEKLKSLEAGPRGELSYATCALELGMSQGALRGAAHRLRQRHQEILREEIARTVGSPEDVDEEIRHLLRVSWS